MLRLQFALHLDPLERVRPVHGRTAYSYGRCALFPGPALYGEVINARYSASSLQKEVSVNDYPGVVTIRRVTGNTARLPHLRGSIRLTGVEPLPARLGMGAT